MAIRKWQAGKQAQRHLILRVPPWDVWNLHTDVCAQVCVSVCVWVTISECIASFQWATFSWWLLKMLNETEYQHTSLRHTSNISHQRKGRFTFVVCLHHPWKVIQAFSTVLIFILESGVRTPSTLLCSPFIQTFIMFSRFLQGFCHGSGGEESSCNAGDPGSIPELGRSHGERNGILQYSCLGNPMDRGAWLATVHGVTKNQTWPSK